MYCACKSTAPPAAGQAVDAGRPTDDGGLAATPASALPTPSGAAGPVDVAAAATDPEDALWREAGSLDEPALVRLALALGAAGLEEGAESDANRVSTALHAMAYADGMHGVLWLATHVVRGDADAEGALESLEIVAARKRSQRDPEDATELREGCALLLAYARAEAGARPARARVVSVLRELAEYGCIALKDIPASLDGK